MYYVLLAQMKKHLTQLDKWLEAASAFAKEKSFDPKVFMEPEARAGSVPFARQVRTACDTAKLAASRVSGKEAPVHTDGETTLEELRERARSVVDYLAAFTAADFEGAATRTVTQPRWEGKIMSSADYFVEHALPNFYFHLTHAYALLRHNGVHLGKRDFLGQLSQRMP